jgi:hypothetical protein
VLKEAHHETGHRKRKAMEEHVKGRGLYLPGLRGLAQRFADSCSSCFKVEPLKSKPIVKRPIVANHVLERFEMDFTDATTDKYGFMTILTVTDCYSKYAFVEGAGFSLAIILIQFSFSIQGEEGCRRSSQPDQGQAWGQVR